MYRSDDLPAGHRSATSVKKKKMRMNATVHSSAAAVEVMVLHWAALCEPVAKASPPHCY
jgi:hypothetical protein